MLYWFPEATAPEISAFADSAPAGTKKQQQKKKQAEPYHVYLA